MSWGWERVESVREREENEWERVEESWKGRESLRVKKARVKKVERKKSEWRSWEREKARKKIESKKKWRKKMEPNVVEVFCFFLFFCCIFFDCFENIIS